MRYIFLIPAIVIAAMCSPIHFVHAAPLVTGFDSETIASGFMLPTSIAFLPDGRMLVAEKGGTIHLVSGGVVNPTPVISIPNVNDFADRGVLGLAVDPAFSSNGFIYVAYTHENSPGDYEGPKTGRIVRFTMVGNTASPSSMLILVGSIAGDTTNPSCANFAKTADCIYSDSPSHSVGGLRFGPDGFLYATLGDGAGFDRVDPMALNAQDLDVLAGKVLRITKLGKGVPSNPFYSGNPDDNRSKVWAYGLRNSFRFNFRPSTGRLYAGEVGWFTTEEINLGTAGANYGWPCREGNGPTPGYGCDVASPTNPIYLLARDPENINAVVGGVFLGSNYPAPYQDNYIFGHFGPNIIYHMVLSGDATVSSVTPLFDDTMGPVDIVMGPDGYVYVASIYTGEIWRIIFSDDTPPIATASANPLFGNAPLTVAFSSAGSNDPDGSPITYAWDFGDGGSSTAANPSHTYTGNGIYTVTLTVRDGSGRTDADTVVIEVGDVEPPVNSFRGYFFNNMGLTGSPTHILNTYRIDYLWGLDRPHPSVIPDQFSSRFIGNIPFTSGDYRFFITGDDGVRLYVDDVLIVDAWVDQPATEYTADLSITEGNHEIHVEHYDNGYAATLRLRWDRIGGQGGGTTIVPTHVSTVVDDAEPTVADLLNFTTTVRNDGAPGAVLVDIELFNAAGEKIAQEFYDNETFAADETKTFAMSWLPIASGTYRLAVGLLQPGWGGVYEWTNAAYTFTVRDRRPPGEEVFNPQHVSTVVVPGTVGVGNPVTITSTFRNTGGAGEALIDIEIYKDGEKIGQEFFDHSVFAADEERTFMMQFTPTETGEYGIDIGVFESEWAGFRQWLAHVSEFTVDTTSGGGGGDPVSSDAIIFDGVNDYVNVGGWDIEEQTFTIEADATFTDFSDDHMLIAKVSSSTPGTFWTFGARPKVTGTDGELVFFLRTTTGLTSVAGGTITPGEFVHVAATYDGAQMRIYKNGTLVGSTAKTGDIVRDITIPVHLGGTPIDPAGSPMHGSLDMMRVWNIVLDGSELNTNIATPPTVGPHDGLIKFWIFDEGFGQDVLDKSRTGHHGWLGSVRAVDMHDPTWSNGGSTSITGTFDPEHVSTTIVPVGDAYDINVRIRNTGDAPGHLVLNIEIKNEGGTTVDQLILDGETFEVGETRTLTRRWTPPDAATYRVAVGLVHLYWTGLYQWIDEAAHIPPEDGEVPPVPMGLLIYGDALETGWMNWSWDTTVDLANAANPDEGTHAIRVAHTAIWGGLYVSHAGLDTTGHDELVFRISGVDSAGRDLQIRFYVATFAPRIQRRLGAYLDSVSIPTGSYATVRISLADLDIENQLTTGFVIQGASGAVEAPYLIDNIRLE